MEKSASVPTLARVDLYRQHIQDQVVRSARSLTEGAIQGVARLQQKYNPCKEPNGRVNYQLIRFRAKAAIAATLMAAGILGAATCDESSKSPQTDTNNVVNILEGQK